MTSSRKLFADEIIEWLLEVGFIQLQCRMSIYYNYAQYGKNIVVLSYVYDFVYWYTSEALGKRFVDTLKNSCELLGIYTLVHFNKNFSDEGSFHFSISG